MKGMRNKVAVANATAFPILRMQLRPAILSTVVIAAILVSKASAQIVPKKYESLATTRSGCYPSIDHNCFPCPREYCCTVDSNATCPPVIFPPRDAGVSTQGLGCYGDQIGRCPEYSFVEDNSFAYADTYMYKNWTYQFPVMNMFNVLIPNPWMTAETFPSFSAPLESIATVEFRHYLPRIMKRYAIKARPDIPFHAQTPTRWTSSGRLNGNWTLLDTVVSPNWQPGEVRNFTINNTVAYDMYRWQFSHTNAEFAGRNRTEIAIQKMELEFHRGSVFPYCLCPRGTHFNESCQPCPVDHYCDGNSPPTRCPTGGTNGVGAPGFESCFCRFGWYGPAATNCTICPKGYYCRPPSLIPIKCTFGRTDSEGVDSEYDCRCPPGMQSTGTACELCPVGYFCSSRYPHAEYCQFESIAVGAKSIEDCRCPDGSYLNENACKSCPVGSYCNGNRRIDCPEGSTTDGIGSASLDACKWTKSGAQLDGCYWTDNKTCADCPVGSFCVAGEKRQCPANSVTIKDRSTNLGDCLCMEGFHGSNGNCRACAKGAFCLQSSLAPVPCPRGSYCPDGRAPIKCPGNTTTISISAASNSDCVCAPGMELMQGVCIQCESDNFKNTFGNTPCLPLPDLAVTTPDRINWECARNATLEQDRCVPCLKESYKLQSGNESCYECREAVVTCKECAESPTEVCTICARIMRCDGDQSSVSMTLVYTATIATVSAGLLVFGLFFFVSGRKNRSERTPSAADLLARQVTSTTKASSFTPGSLPLNSAT